jgi:hypothetical protein
MATSRQRETDRIRWKLWSSTVRLRRLAVLPEQFFKDYEGHVTGTFFIMRDGPAHVGLKFSSNKIKLMALMKYADYIENTPDYHDI